MSMFSGKCDFYDHVFMTSDPKVTELDLFEKFKKDTGGVIYQHFDLELTKDNVEKEAAANEFLTKNEDGTFTYFGKTYKTLKSLNREGYTATKAIHFERLLDLVKYFPYLISLSMYCDGSHKVVVSSCSYVDQEYKELRKYGYESRMTEYYERALAEKYVEVAELEKANARSEQN